MHVAVPGARTLAGIGLGDSLRKARAGYPRVSCDVRNQDSEYEPYPYCTARLKRGLYIWFGQDPIRSITISSTPLA